MAEPNNLIGSLVENRFEVLSLLGEGGMATVYQAEHKAVHLQVAIKVLKSESGLDEYDIERLKREARALNSLFHPNVVKVYSFGFLDSGQPYLVLDLLKGRSLGEIIESGELPALDWSIEAFVQICRGLHSAHESGLIHRDLKPSNVMVVDRDEEGAFVKLLDFGIAKSTAPKDNEQKLTGKGEIFGSPLYMSPEQISGKSLDKRADIYSLGCLMYETLTGKPPVIGETVILTMVKHLQEKPAALNDAFKREYPKGLEDIVFKCMEKEPSNRFDSALEIEQALSQLN